jgi:hypothetical protein
MKARIPSALLCLLSLSSAWPLAAQAKDRHFILLPPNHLAMPTDFYVARECPGCPSVQERGKTLTRVEDYFKWFAQNDPRASRSSLVVLQNQKQNVTPAVVAEVSAAIKLKRVPTILWMSHGEIKRPEGLSPETDFTHLDWFHWITPMELRDLSGGFVGLKDFFASIATAAGPSSVELVGATCEMGGGRYDFYETRFQSRDTRLWTYGGQIPISEPEAMNFMAGYFGQWFDNPDAEYRHGTASKHLVFEQSHYSDAQIQGFIHAEAEKDRGMHQRILGELCDALGSPEPCAR